MLVARIAWDKLTPSARAAVEDLASDPNNPGAGISTTDRDDDVFTASTWMDDIKGHSYRELHYVNTPLNGNGKIEAGENAVTFERQEIAVLKDPQATRDQKAEALRVVEHLAGDLHMPLHNCDNGDRGGNSFKLDGRKSLHGMWDSGGNQWGSIKRPLSPQGKEQLSELAAGAEKQFPEEDLAGQVKDLDPAHWSHEGWELARQDVYQGVTQGKAPSAAYTKRARKDMTRQAALAGYRLASILNSAFPESAGNIA
jgi:hypothetical protein